jgi:hypothetical protein
MEIKNGLNKFNPKTSPQFTKLVHTTPLYTRSSFKIIPKINLTGRFTKNEKD